MKQVTAGDIYDFLDSFAPFATAMDFDNAGLLVGDRDVPVSSVLLSLDITPGVVEEAAQLGAQLIVSHHPVIFDPLKRLIPHTAPYLLARYGIAAVCAHTNLDLAPGGVNTCLAGALGLRNVRTLREYRESGLAEGLMGELEQEYDPHGFAVYVKQALHCGGLKYVDGGKKVKTVGLCSGGGAELLPDAAGKGLDAFVTADTRHHQLLLAAQSGVTLVDAGHFCTEDVVILPLQKRLSERFPAVSFRKSRVMRDPAEYL
ncbi:MAG TPA: Nif3-like dinuclear metal center hexameric protein [Ruminococcaceae bacterium]|jgi:dinuclear metal center YbgI/SA1388 family protein|nr:Nif3-like dinuclear metal center hexameric protein [Oscillospiraceae bacterium]